MSNDMYLVCTHHPDRVHSFRLAHRRYPLSCYITAVSARKLDSSLNDWLEEHAKCGASRDHFTIAFDEPKDHDLPKIQPVANGVHLALVSSTEPRSD